MQEVWKDIPNIPNYQASNLGRIRSLDRIVKRTKFEKGVELKVTSNIRPNGTISLSYRFQSGDFKQQWYEKKCLSLFTEEELLLENEIWKFIPESNEAFMVSNKFNAKSLDRTVMNNKTQKGRILKPKTKLRGHQEVNISDVNGDEKMYGVHRLVALTFIPNPENKRCVNHIDNNPANNHVSNLEWCTHQENMDHMNKQGRGAGKKVLRSDGVIYHSFTHAARENGVSISSINKYVLGKRNDPRGYKWSILPR